VSSLVTLSKSSPLYKDYLLGTFSNEKRALPIATLNVNKNNETVTFNILDKQNIVKPNFIQFLFQTLKIKKWLLVLFPMLIVLSKNIAFGAVTDPISLWLSSFGILFLFISANLRNDFVDHYWGVDRIFDHRGSRAIQSGWVTAVQVRTLSRFFLVLAILFSVPILIAYPSAFYVVTVSGFLILFSQFTSKNSVYYQLGNEISYFFLIGPLLSTGYQLSMGAPFDYEVIMIGILWGWLVLFVHFLSTLINIMPCSQAGFKNTITMLGFDKSRRFLAFWWTLYVVLYFFYHLFFAGSYWAWYFSLVLLLLTPRIVLKFKSVKSPLGSDLVRLNEIGKRFFYLVILVWLIESLWVFL